MFNFDDNIVLGVLMAVVAVVLFAVAGVLAYRNFKPDFEQAYGQRSGPIMLLLFLVDFPLFVVAHVFDRYRNRQEDTNTQRDSSDREPPSGPSQPE